MLRVSKTKENCAILNQQRYCAMVIYWKRKWICHHKTNAIFKSWLLACSKLHSIHDEHGLANDYDCSFQNCFSIYCRICEQYKTIDSISLNQQEHGGPCHQIPSTWLWRQSEPLERQAMSESSVHVWLLLYYSFFFFVGCISMQHVWALWVTARIMMSFPVCPAWANKNSD